MDNQNENGGSGHDENVEDVAAHTTADIAAMREAAERNLTGLFEAVFQGTDARAGAGGPSLSALLSQGPGLEALLGAAGLPAPPPPTVVSEQEINTFCEFTGLADRELARAYLSETETLEEAVNLCLSGVDIEALRASRAPPMAVASRCVSVVVVVVIFSVWHCSVVTSFV
jgi:hypothetical protein